MWDCTIVNHDWLDPLVVESRYKQRAMDDHGTKVLCNELKVHVVMHIMFITNMVSVAN